MKRVKTRLKARKRTLHTNRIHRILRIQKRRKHLVTARFRVGFHQFGGW